MPPTIVTVAAAGGAKRKRTAVRVGSSMNNGGGGKAASSASASKSSPLYEEFIHLLSAPQYKGRGISSSSLKSHFGEDQYPKLVPIINQLTSASRLTMSKSTSKSGGAAGESEVYFSLLTAEEANKLQGLDASSKLVYQVIESSGNMGIWTVDVRMQTNIQQVSLWLMPVYFVYVCTSYV